MTSPSRTALFAKVHRVLKKYYKPVLPNPERPVLEHLLFSCCLENAHYEKAEEAFAALVHTFFDLNEIRVTTAKELSEVLAALPDPTEAANRVKRVLQQVFETTYSFDLEDLRKKGLGQAVEKLKKMSGVSPFCVNYVVQSALGGHAIPVDSGAMQIMSILELVSEKDIDSGTVPGMERAVAKTKGVEFGSLLHQFAADFVANPYVPSVQKILLQIDPDAGDRLPKRRSKGKPDGKPEPAAEGGRPAKGAHAAAAKEERPTKTAEPSEDEKAKAGRKKKGAEAEARPTPAADAPAKKKAAPAKKHAEVEITAHLAKKSATAGLSKRKPR
jgi:endonuclease-3